MGYFSLKKIIIFQVKDKVRTPDVLKEEIRQVGGALLLGPQLYRIAVRNCQHSISTVSTRYLP